MPSLGNEPGKPVSRRRFIEATGAAGIAGSAGCANDGGSQDSGQTNSSDRTVITWATVNELKDVMPKIRKSLWNNGLPKDIYLEFQSTPPGNTNKQKTRYQTWLNAGRSKPDIFLADSAWSYSFVQRGQVSSLNGRIPNDTIQYVDDNFSPQLIPSIKSRDKGEYYGLPFYTNIPVIAYRKDLVADAGFKPDQEGWGVNGMSWKRFSEVIDQTLNQSDVQFGHTFVAAAIEGLACCVFNEVMTSFGGAYFGGRENLFGPVGDRPITVTEEASVTAVRMLRTFIHGQGDEHSLDNYAGNIAPPATLQWDASTSAKPFISGNAVASRSWADNVLTSKKELGAENVGVMPMPFGVPEDQAQYPDTGGIARSFIGGWVNVINSNSENIDAAAKVLQHMVKNQKFRSLLMEESLIPPDMSMVKDLMGEVDAFKPHIDTYTLSGKRGIPRPSTPVWPTEATAISQGINSALSQEKTPQAALSNIRRKLSQIESEQSS